MNLLGAGIPATVTLDHVAIRAGSTISMVGTYQFRPVLKMLGTTVNNGLIDIQTGGSNPVTRTGLTDAQITIDRGASGDRFTNNGVINDWGTKIDAALLGSGEIKFLPPTISPAGWVAAHLQLDECGGRAR